MKKQVISIAVAITLGVSNPVKAFIVGGIPDSSSLQNFFGWSSSSKKQVLHNKRQLLHNKRKCHLLHLSSTS